LKKRYIAFSRKTAQLLEAFIEDKMDKEIRHDTYRTFETATMNGAAHALTAPVRAVHHIGVSLK
jgi:hypothetical protein